MATAGPPCSAHEENVPRTTYRSTSPPSSATKHQTRHSTARHVHVSSHPKTCPSSSVVHVPYYSTATGPASTPSNPPSAAYRRPDRQPTATDDRDSIFSRPPTVARQNAKGHNRKSLPHSLVTSLYFRACPSYLRPQRGGPSVGRSWTAGRQRGGKSAVQGSRPMRPTEPDPPCPKGVTLRPATSLFGAQECSADCRA